MRQTKIETWPVSKLSPADYNPRSISDEAMTGLRASVHRFGLVQPIIVNEKTGNVVGGHQRLKVCVADGVEEVQVVVVNLPPSEERALNVALNNPHIAGEFTGDLSSLLDSIAADEPELFEALRLDELRLYEDDIGHDDDDEEADEDFDAGEDLPVVTRKGDVWVMGQHRLICGDCRDADDVNALLGGDKVNIAFTSPPYASQRKYDEESGFKPIHPDEYVDWFEAVQRNVAAHIADDGSWFVNIKAASDGGAKLLYVLDLVLAHVRAWGWAMVDEFAWLRQALPGDPNSMRRFKNAFEPVFHFARGRFKFNPDAVRHESDGAFSYEDQKAAGRNISAASQGMGGNAQSPVGQGRGLAYPSNVLDIKQGAGVVGHSAAFPVDLPEFFIKAYTDEGDAVFDPFMGSGTTIIACERTGRRGYGTEVSGRYCDIIVRRWEALTGFEATLDSDGRKFGAVEMERGEQ